MNIYIYIEGAGDEDDIELLPRQRPGFRSGIRSGKETITGLRQGFIKFFKNYMILLVKTLKYYRYV
ncbi:hypothetical protein [Nostoc sp.]|uniref:hypothetical protein n=1 Tax=Nostoc sp. TaxID=1180 RepID=UPI002FF72D35